MDIYYTGIGSRTVKDKPEVKARIVALGRLFASLGFILRSGAADGADEAFEEGCDQVGGRKEIWLPWKGFNKHSGVGCYMLPAKDEAMFRDKAMGLHPLGERLLEPKYQGALKLHTRNVGQVLGKDMNTPSAFTVCWTPDGCVNEYNRTENTGGTATAIVLSAREGVPVFNLFNEGAYEKAVEFALRVARRFHVEGSLPKNGEVFTFGSNLAGRHGLGSAKVARDKFGAIYGQGEGRQGQSYGIATKDGRPNCHDLTKPEATLSLEEIRANVEAFIWYAEEHPDENFFVVRLGCVLAGHSDKDIAPMFARAPKNCSFSEQWKPWLGVESRESAPKTAPPINIWSGSKGLGGALTNMSNRAREKGAIKYDYPVEVNGYKFIDAELAYQTLKEQGNAEYNDGLMIDIISLKFLQNPKLYNYVTENGGEAWIAKCSHFTQAKSLSFQSWEGQGTASRFIRNLMLGYTKARTGMGPATRVVHVNDAPFDVYIGREVGSREASIWGNPKQVGVDGDIYSVLEQYARHVEDSPELMKALPSLRYRTIGCWCKKRGKLDELCHGMVLAAMAEGRKWVSQRPEQGELF